MKLKKYSWLAALPLLFTACQDDMLVEKHSQQGIYTLTATVEDGGSASSRAQIGAGADTKNNMVEMNISEVVTINGGSKPWVSVKAVEENLSSHKNVHVRIQGKTYSDELKQKIEVSEGYTGSVMLNNTEIDLVE